MKKQAARRAIVSRVVAEYLEARRLFANDYAVGVEPRGTAIADFNLDGFADVAATNFGATGSSTVSLLRGRGDGTFQAATATTVGSLAYVIAVADFNKDGKPDLVTGNLSDSYTTLIGTGSGGFTATTTATAGQSPTQVLTGDFNGDTNPDFAFINNANDAVRVVLGNGSGGFAAPVVVATGLGSASSFAIGDVDADGDTDIAVTSGGFTAAVLRNNGSGTFAAPQTLTIDTQSYDIGLRDLNGDGRADITVEGVNASVGRINVLLATATTAFTTAAPVPINNSGEMQFVDLNGDGKIDIATESGKAAYGNGNGTFAAPFTTTTATGFFPRYADLNKDGRPDFVTAVSTGSSTNGVVKVRLNGGDGQFVDNVLATPPVTVTGPAAPGQSVVDDFNNDGFLDFVTYSNSSTGDLRFYTGNGSGGFTFTAGYPIPAFPTSITTADFNKDGATDLALSFSGGTVAVMTAFTPGVFNAPVSMAAGTSPQDVGSGDFNGDGKADLAVINQITGGTLRTWLGNGDGTFGSVTVTNTGVDALNDLDIADVNSDGRSDVAVVGISTTTPTYAVLRASPAGNGTFTNSSSAILGGAGLSIAFGEFNGGNGIDLAVGTTNGGGAVHILPGNDTGAFAFTTAAVTTGYSPLRMVARDYNNDSRTDVIVGGLGSTGSNGRVQVLLGTGAGGLGATPSVDIISGRYIAPGDFNGDGRLDVLANNDGSSTMSFLFNQVPALAAPFGSVSGGVLTIPAGTLSGLRETAGVIRVVNSSNNPVQYFDASAIKSVVITGTPSFNFTLFNDLGQSGGMRNVSFAAPTGASLSFSAQHLNALTVPNNSSFRMTTGGIRRVLRVQSMTIGTGTAYVDLVNNDFIYDYTGTSPLVPTLLPLMVSARNGGAWNGYGLTSLQALGNGSTTIGFLEATDYKAFNGGPAATFNGEVIDNTAVVMRYTYYGDTDLDGGVSINDFNRLAANFGVPSGTLWANGDFDLDRGVSINDFNLLAANFGKTLPSSAAGPLVKTKVTTVKAKR